MRQLTILATILFAAACASTPPPPPPEPFTEVPARALEALCASAVHGDGIGNETSIRVVTTSQPLIKENSLRSLATAYSAKKVLQYPEIPGVLPVVIPTSGCRWFPVGKENRHAERDQYLMELSAPVANPFAKKEMGLFARLSLGGQSATWYWVPLLRKNGHVGVGAVIPLDLRE